MKLYYQTSTRIQESFPTFLPNSMDEFYKILQLTSRCSFFSSLFCLLLPIGLSIYLLSPVLRNRSLRFTETFRPSLKLFSPKVGIIELLDSVHFECIYLPVNVEETANSSTNSLFLITWNNKRLSNLEFLKRIFFFNFLFDMEH